MYNLCTTKAHTQPQPSVHMRTHTRGPLLTPPPLHPGLTRGSIQQDALGRLHANGLEQLGVAQGQLHQLADLGQLLAHTAHVVVANLGCGCGGSRAVRLRWCGLQGCRAHLVHESLSTCSFQHPLSSITVSLGGGTPPSLLPTLFTGTAQHLKSLLAININKFLHPFLPANPNCPYLVQLLLILPLDGLPLTENLCVRSHDAVLSRVRLNHLS